MEISMRTAVAGACLGSLLFASIARPAPQQPEPLPAWYLGLLGGTVLPDSARDTGNGTNGQLVIGVLFDEAVGLELNGFHQTTARDADDVEESSYGAGLDLVLGPPDPGSVLFLMGGGSIREEIGGTRYTSTYGNLGLGLYLPFSFAGELWRIEARYNAIFNDQAAPSVELLEDLRFNVGVVFGFGALDVPVESDEIEFVTPPPAPPPAAPVADADQDDVADAADQCPGTPRWVRPDARGCAPDSDGDGVDETRDLCPGTAPGTAVDGQGCEPRPAAADADDDRDAVAASADRCPHSPEGYPVDDKGCIRIESVVIKNVIFPVDYYALTPEAYRLLNAVAASLRANPGTRIEIAGYADSIGNDQYNLKLSQRRAEVVRDFLLWAGVPRERMEPRGYGEAQPVADNNTEAGRAENRRVSFKILRAP